MEMGFNLAEYYENIILDAMIKLEVTEKIEHPGAKDNLAMIIQDMQIQDKLYLRLDKLTK
jgi:hypothetical protein